MNTKLIQYHMLDLEGIIASGIASKERPKEIAEKIAQLSPTHCPYDCDSCHDYDCPCDRMGCAGSGVELH